MDFDEVKKDLLENVVQVESGRGMTRVPGCAKLLVTPKANEVATELRSGGEQLRARLRRGERLRREHHRKNEGSKEDEQQQAEIGGREERELEARQEAADLDETGGEEEPEGSPFLRISD